MSVPSIDSKKFNSESTGLFPSIRLIPYFLDISGDKMESYIGNNSSRSLVRDDEKEILSEFFLNYSDSDVFIYILVEQGYPDLTGHHWHSEK